MQAFATQNCHHQAMTPDRPLTPPIEPMLARPTDETLDSFEAAAFEPKWDGFRCLAFHLPSGPILQGRGRSRGTAEFVDLSYAFPELVAALADATNVGAVIDGEIVVAVENRLDFAALSSRLRPRSHAGGESIRRLAEQLPATFLAFDLLAAGPSTMDLPYLERSHRLIELAGSWGGPVHLTPSTQDHVTAERWFREYESAGVDGLIIKPLEDPYQPGIRAQWKLKHRRSADVVVGGWRSKVGRDGSDVVGSLLLGLYDSDGVLHYIGGTAAFTDVARRDLVTALADSQLPAGAAHPWLDSGQARVPGGASRWGAASPWRPLVPELVAEVGYDQIQDGRFRHPASFIRWRPDRDARSCDLGQFPDPKPASIGQLLDWAAP